MTATSKRPAVRPSPRSIREALPTCSPANADVMRRLFTAPRGYASIGDSGISLRIRPAPSLRLGELAECSAGDDTFLIGLLRDDIVEDRDELAWSDYVGDARLLAWSLAHERLLDAIANALGRAVVPHKLAKSLTASSDALWLGFDAQTTEASSTGVLALPPALATTLIEFYAAAAPTATPAPRADWSNLPCALTVHTGVLTLDAATLASLHPGDVLVLGARERVMQSLVVGIGGDVRWNATYNDNHLHIVAARDGRDFREKPMNEHVSVETQENPEGSASTSERPIPIPVQLDFQIGEVETNLRELGRIEPGYIFELPSRLEGANVAIRANGKRVGTGELVAVGETLGVRLTEWRSDGF